MSFWYLSIQQQEQQHNSGGWDNNNNINSNNLYIATDLGTNKKKVIDRLDRARFQFSSCANALPTTKTTYTFLLQNNNNG
jgi:hypothetical protein